MGKLVFIHFPTQYPHPNLASVVVVGAVFGLGSLPLAN